MFIVGRGQKYESRVSISVSEKTEEGLAVEHMGASGTLTTIKGEESHKHFGNNLKLGGHLSELGETGRNSKYQWRFGELASVGNTAPEGN